MEARARAPFWLVGVRCELGVRPGSWLVGYELDYPFADIGEVSTDVHEDFRSDTLSFSDEAEQDVFGADVVVAEVDRFPDRKFEDLLCPRRERDMPRARV